MTLTPKNVQSTNKKTSVPRKKSTAHCKTKKILLNDELVSDYLIQNPDFFIRHAKQIEEMNIPHPVRGVISLSEWQLARQRNKIRQLESEITLLMEHACSNEQLFESLMRLQNELLLASDLNDLLAKLNQWAKSLGLVGAYLYLFDNKWQLNIPSSYRHFALSTDKFDFIRVRHLQYNYQYLGQLNNTELNLLIPEKTYIGSVALSLLGRFGDLGVLVFASRNPNHYQTGQGTLLIQKISEMLPILINRWVIRKN
ncbi:DUF484 domain-containing protein [Orbus wheelerorum]|uniref:DUF484 domain-containing protein n=1 Tax=Orbus wheelerorum TaxID=3074111 RepID=UPI00370DCF1D